MLTRDLHIRVINAATCELLRELVLDPTRNYQPTGWPPGLKPKKTPNQMRVRARPMSCDITKRARRDSNPNLLIRRCHWQRPHWFRMVSGLAVLPTGRQQSSATVPGRPRRWLPRWLPAPAWPANAGYAEICCCCVARMVVARQAAWRAAPLRRPSGSLRCDLHGTCGCWYRPQLVRGRGGSCRRCRWRCLYGCLYRPLGCRLGTVEAAALGSCCGRAGCEAGRAGSRSAAGAERAGLGRVGRGIGAKAAGSAAAIGALRSRSLDTGNGPMGNQHG